MVIRDTLIDRKSKYVTYKNNSLEHTDWTALKRHDRIIG